MRHIHIGKYVRKLHVVCCHEKDLETKYTETKIADFWNSSFTKKKKKSEHKVLQFLKGHEIKKKLKSSKRIFCMKRWFWYGAQMEKKA